MSYIYIHLHKLNAAHVLLIVGIMEPNEMLSLVIMQWERQQAMCVCVCVCACVPPPYIFAHTQLTIEPYISLWSVHVYVKGEARGGTHH